MSPTLRKRKRPVATENEGDAEETSSAIAPSPKKEVLSSTEQKSTPSKAKVESSTASKKTGEASAKKTSRSSKNSPSSKNKKNASTSKTNKSSVKKTPSTKEKKKRKESKKEKEDKEGGGEKEEKEVKGEKQQEQEKEKEKAKKKKKPNHQVLTERSEIPKLWSNEKAELNGSYTFKIASWNVAGLRALLRKMPDALGNLVKKHDLDVLCLQETKLQEDHLDDPKLKIRGHLLEDEGYDGYYSCSVAKKGYSGTAVFVKRHVATKPKKKQKDITSFFGKPKKEESSTSTTVENSNDNNLDKQELKTEDVSYKMGKVQHDQEGRFINVDFKLFSICNVYVPNSGQKLDRLDYRTKEWDVDMLQFVQKKQQTTKCPILWLGDLNVAHTHLDVWNDGAKHLATQAGTTEQERDSFSAQLDAGFVDCFRKLHPTAMGHYSYWSTRAGNRGPNKGLRLDYFIGDSSLFEETSRVIVRDCYMIDEQEGSDHCPVLLELEVKRQSKEE